MFNDFNKLNTFIEVAKLGSISKAADKLFRTQSAITQQIQGLEEELDLSLFVRQKSRIYLTKEGEKIFHFAESRIQEIVENLHQVKGKLNQLVVL